ncbi:MAG: hypothetical protein CVU65_13030 [Deltaproteobacteria bacterium HGW-Deltaproteobacteria-22]|jgi:hypothetical protein|nr:MAG: hypothetical protein CVU65_13030 [Deltaproteobacteria bacterium HGW-Deltaproteobacteria-22]
MTSIWLILALLQTQTTPNSAEKWRQNWLKISENNNTRGRLSPTWHGQTRPEARSGEDPGARPAGKPEPKPSAKPGEKPLPTAERRPIVTGTAQPVGPRPPGAGKPRPALAAGFENQSAEQLIKSIGWAIDVKGQFTAAADLDGQVCLNTLTRLKVPWKPGRQKRGLSNPVELTTHMLNGVYYHWYWASDPDMLLDCRMVLALYIAAPVFRKHGFDEVLYTSSYRYSRISGTRRLSRHAVGMALDVKALRGPNGLVVVVERDWHRYKGTIEDCVGPLPQGPARKMRELVCEFETLPLFGGILTPDYDYDHRNHFHIGGVLPGEKWTRHRAAGRPLRRKGSAGYRYVSTLKYPLPKRPAQLPPWPAGVDPQAPMQNKGTLPKSDEPEIEVTPPDTVKPPVVPDTVKPDTDSTEDSPPPDEKPDPAKPADEIEGPPEEKPATPEKPVETPTEKPAEASPSR